MMTGDDWAEGAGQLASLAAPSCVDAIAHFDFDVSSVTPKAGQGTFFHEHIDLTEPAGEALTQRLVAIYDQVRPKKRKRGRDVLRLRLRRLAANALRGHFFRDVSAILYFRGATTREYNDKPGWMKHGALADIVDALRDARLVDGITGEKTSWNSGRKSTASSYWATDALVQLAGECGIGARSIDQPMPTDELVQLYRPKPKAWFDTGIRKLVQSRKGRRIWFEPTPETQEWTAALVAINAFYRQQEITPPPAELNNWLAERNADPNRKGAPFRMPETFATDLYRVFNNGEADNPQFDQGGRLFGGWWMHVPEEVRVAITINGMETVELDYRYCHPGMLYAERKIACPGDLYELPEIAACEAQTGESYRDCIKWLMQVLLNGKRRPNEDERPEGTAFPPGFTMAGLCAVLEAHHQSIADAFGKGVGLRLMRLESDIALEIVSTAVAEGWTVLPIHDSFVTTIDKRDRLRAMMVDAYVHRLHTEPAIKERRKVERLERI